MSVLTAEPAPPIPIPNVNAAEEYGIDPSIAYSAACADVIRSARRLPEDSTLALAGLLVSTEVEVARVHQDMKQTMGVNPEIFRRKTNFLEQYPGMFITERGMSQTEADMAVTLAIGALFALRAQPDAPFNLYDFLEGNRSLEESAIA